MKCHLLVGDGSWPVDMLLRRVLGEEVEAPLRVLDLQGRGATQLDVTMRRALTTRGTRWYDLGERRAPRCPWRYRPTDADDRVLHHLVSGWVTILGGAPVAAEVDAFVARARSFARVVQGASATLPSWSLVDLVNTLRAPPPLLAARVEHIGPLFAPSLEAILEALVRALRYPAVFAAATAPELSLGDPPQRVDWYELPRGHLEPMEWQLLARLVTAVTMQHAVAAEVVVLDPARGAGTRIDPRCFVGAARVSAAWTPAGEAAEVVLQPWVELHASVWVARNRLPLSAWTNKLPGEAARTLATLQADEMIATRLSPEGHWLRRRLRRDEAVIPVPRGINRRREDAPAHLADAAQSALRLASPSHGLLSRVASLPLLRRAWHRLRTLRPDYVGTDAVTARQFGDGLDSHLHTLRSELLEGTYRPLPMRRFHIPKDDGGKRTLGIVAVRDRIVQTACLDVLDPLLDATFSDHSYAYRVRRGAPPAVLAAWDAIRAGARWLVRCDVAQCFDSLDHAVLFTRLREVIADDALLHLLGLWARADILVGDDLVPTDVGVAQGTVLAPLLCNLYLTPLDRALEAAGVPFVRYADDLLLCGPDEASAREALSLTERVLAGPLRLQLNPRKTQVVSAEQGVDHLGFRLSAKGLDMHPAKKDKLLDEVRRRLGKIVEASTRGEESLREAFMALRAVLNGFAAYYESVGEAPRVQASLVQLGRAVHSLAQDVLPPGLQQHPVWARRGPLWRAEVPEPVVARPDPVGAYPEEQHRAVTPPPSPETRVEEVAREKEGAEVPRAAGVLLEDGHLHVMRHGVYLSLRADALVVRARGVEVERFALQPMRAVTVTGHGVTLSASLARWLAQAEVPLLLGSPTDTRYTLITSPSAGVPRVRVAQVLARDRPEVARAGLAMLHAKIAGQASLLKYYAKYRRRCGDDLHQQLDETAARIRTCAARVRTVSPEGWESQRKVAMGHEGHGAALYWEAVARMVPEELGFKARRTRGADDPLNQSLNYAYGCLYAEVWRAVLGVGLDPHLGILHGSERGDASLVFDLVEELRPNFADRLIFSLLGRGFRPRIGRHGRLAVSCRRLIAHAFLRSAARGAQWRGAQQSLARIAHGQARTLRALVLGEVNTYRGFHLRW